MEKLADISAFDALGNNAACTSPMAVFNADTTVWSSPGIAYDVVKRDDGSFVLQCSVQGSAPEILGKYESARAAIDAAKKKMESDNVRADSGAVRPRK